MKMKIFGHRGSMGLYTENTIYSIQMALDEGVHGLEIDMHMSKDGELIIHHDEDIKNGGLIKDLTLEQISSFNVGGHPIPTLQNVLNLLKGKDIELNIELKTSIVSYKGIEEKTLACVAASGFDGKVIYSSFHLPTILRIKELDPQAYIAFLTIFPLTHPIDYIQTFALDAIHISINTLLLTMEHFDGVYDKLRVWPVNEKKDMQLLANKGVAAIITDYPSRFL